MIDLEDRPGVITFPPLIPTTAILAAVALHLLIPVPFPAPLAVRWLGAGVMLAGILVAIAARREFIKAGTNVNPMEPSTTIVTSGPFRFSRNPMYVSMVVAYLGLALLTRIAWFFVLLPFVLGALHWGVVQREERYLSRKFGEAYASYRGRVRRYF